MNAALGRLLLQCALQPAQFICDFIPARVHLGLGLKQTKATKRATHRENATGDGGKLDTRGPVLA